MNKQALKARLSTAPLVCGSCTLCCQGDAVRLLPEDDASQYQTEPHPYRSGELMLAHAANGDCIYLDRETGCTIHETKPTQCRAMDCRAYPLIWPTKSKFRKAAGRACSPKVWQAGRSRLAQTPKP
jgi:Fe-S-cluster containining protein